MKLKITPEIEYSNQQQKEEMSAVNGQETNVKELHP